MKSSNAFRRSKNFLLSAVAVILFGGVCSSTTGNILHNFSRLPQGAAPESSLIEDTSGNLYGTTYAGGGFGTVFELSPSVNGTWTEKVLYTFRGTPTAGTDGAYPAGGLIFDTAGNIYGTTSQGGLYGQGTVFELTQSTDGRWQENIIHTFQGYPADGGDPVASLIFDKAGNLYGTTAEGGNSDSCGDQYYPNSCGTVFELSLVAGNWTETTLYDFQGGADGGLPLGSVTFDPAGNLYGTTVTSYAGGEFSGPGTVFELTPKPGGGWVETTIYAFTNSEDFGNPAAGLIFDSAGNLYGTESEGNVFELSPSSGGTWIETMAYPLNSYPEAALIIDSSGNLFGTTVSGGSSSLGTVFELSPGVNSWTGSTIYSFTGGNDGTSPKASLLLDSSGSLLATSSAGANSGCYFEPGEPGCGAVVKLTDSSSGVWTVAAFYDFPAPQDGSSPVASLISDGSGNLFGTTEYGGTSRCSYGQFQGCGTVFELSPTAEGKWKTTVIYSFAGGSADGANPVSGLVFDSMGNLYGTTQSGGNQTCDGQFFCGTVFELSPTGSGTWQETVIYFFGLNPGDGYQPLSSLAIDDYGSLYGTTIAGGAQDGGTLFQLVNTPTGWHENILYAFGPESIPQGGLIFDQRGNLYGTTRSGGLHYAGSVFELAHGASVWTEKVLYSFHGFDGGWPESSLVFDKQGNLYGTGWTGGTYSAGVVFELTPGSNGEWSESVLHNFVGVNGDGGNPTSNLIFDDAGNLFGTTSIGGINGGGCGGLGCGTAFELTPSSGGVWNERVLHRFTGGVDGGQPYDGLIFCPDGNLCATTSSGGSAAQGNVFEITP